MLNLVIKKKKCSIFLINQVKNLSPLVSCLSCIAGIHQQPNHFSTFYLHWNDSKHCLNAGMLPKMFSRHSQSYYQLRGQSISENDLLPNPRIIFACYLQNQICVCLYLIIPLNPKKEWENFFKYQWRKTIIRMVPMSDQAVTPICPVRPIICSLGQY